MHRIDTRLHRLFQTLAAPSMTESSKRIGSFGLIADVQFADDEDGWNFRKTSRRYYRHGLEVLRWATSDWMKEFDDDTLKGDPAAMSFAVDLGDVIDGMNEALGQSFQALDATKDVFHRFQQHVGPVHHCVGNHELYNFSKETYVKQLTNHTHSARVGPESLPPSEVKAPYYSFTMPTMPSFVFVVLDPYGHSVLGLPTDSPGYVAAEKLLAEQNPNENKNSPLGLPRNESLRFTAFNGGIDDEQFAWLEKTLESAAAQSQNVVVFTHVPIHPDTCLPGGVLLWNYLELQHLFRRHASTVRVVFSGHSHKNGYAEDHGVHYMVFHAALECPPSTDDTTNRAYASVDVFESALHVRGAGIIPTRTLTWTKG
ncbi:unnamed protein product [Aphanomyces euteiches]